MNVIMKTCRLIGIATSVVATVVILGCGDDSGLEARYKVGGKVTYKGEPVAKGTIAFVPADAAKGRAASGTIENGSYSLTTATNGDGALPGDYKVTVTSTDLNVADVAKKTGGLLHQGEAEHKKAIKEAKSSIPTRYNLPDTSKLTAKVEARSNTIDFPLKDD